MQVTTPPSLQSQARLPTATPVGTYGADCLIRYARVGFPALASGGRIALTKLPPPPVPQEPRISSPAVNGELTQRLSNACAYSQRTLPPSGLSAYMPWPWLSKMRAGAPFLGS